MTRQEKIKAAEERIKELETLIKHLKKQNLSFTLNQYFSYGWTWKKIADIYGDGVAPSTVRRWGDLSNFIHLQTVIVFA